MADVPARLRAQQFALSRHLRDPATVAPPDGIEERRLAVYRDRLNGQVRTVPPALGRS